MKFYLIVKFASCQDATVLDRFGLKKDDYNYIMSFNNGSSQFQKKKTDKTYADTELAKKADNVDIQNLDNGLANKLDTTTLSKSLTQDDKGYIKMKWSVNMNKNTIYQIRDPENPSEAVKKRTLYVLKTELQNFISTSIQTAVTQTKNEFGGLIVQK